MEEKQTNSEERKMLSNLLLQKVSPNQSLWCLFLLFCFYCSDTAVVWNILLCNFILIVCSDGMISVEPKSLVTGYKIAVELGYTFLLICFQNILSSLGLDTG